MENCKDCIVIGMPNCKGFKITLGIPDMAEIGKPFQMLYITDKKKYVIAITFTEIEEV